MKKKTTHQLGMIGLGRMGGGWGEVVQRIVEALVLSSLRQLAGAGAPEAETTMKKRMLYLGPDTSSWRTVAGRVIPTLPIGVDQRKARKTNQ